MKVKIGRSRMRDSPQSVQVRRTILDRHRFLRYEGAHVEVDAAYTNKPPGGVATAVRSVTEAVHMIERMGHHGASLGRSADFRMKNPCRAVSGSSPTGNLRQRNYHAALEKAMDMIGYRELRKEQ
jgi:carbon-monoxide dehydrogenase large subunit